MSQVSKGAVREYLKQFPDGMFAGLARIRIKELEAAQ